MECQTLIYDKSDSIVTISLNRPQTLNAINRQMMHELDQVLADVKADQDARVVILRGEGRAFCAGFDLKEEAVDVVAGPEEWFPRFTDDWEIFLKIWRLDKPVIAAVHGYCLAGAMELMLLCDIAIASEEAVFGLPEVRHASGPGMGLLLYAIGSLKKVKELMMLGDSFTAMQAEQIGLVNEVVPLETLEVTVRDAARRLALIPPAGMRITKLYINHVVEMMGLSQTIAYGTALSAVLTASRDYLDLEEMRKDPQELRDFFRKRDEEFKRRI